MILFAGEFLQRVEVGLSLVEDHVHLLYLVPIILDRSVLATEFLLGINPVEDGIARSEKP